LFIKIDDIFGGVVESKDPSIENVSFIINL
jgi:hypothetical protein